MKHLIQLTLMKSDNTVIVSDGSTELTMQHTDHNLRYLIGSKHLNTAFKYSNTAKVYVHSSRFDTFIR